MPDWVSTEWIKEMGKLVNSRVGLLVIFIAYTASPWGLGTKLDNLVRAQDRLVAQLEDTRQMSIANKERLIRLLERFEICQFKRQDSGIEANSGDNYTANR